MLQFAGIIGIIQIFFAIVIGIYFWNLLRSQQTSKTAVVRVSRKEMDKLNHMKSISLSEPLSEKTRPACFTEIIGQEDGMKALKAALCGPNPQHVIIYGPPGVGKTAVARLILEEAKKNADSPFGPFSKFFELDATIARFDERGIADPLIGSVHDPIYQGAGPMGVAGIPQPKPGAVTKAHGGVLFIDEIGELHSIQMNKLLKVLEDRKVILESAYYSSEDTNIPDHIHEIFQRGLPADFRLVGATTKTPDHIPPALRSRCMEIFFRGLLPDEIAVIARNAAEKVDFVLGEKAVEIIGNYAQNGREAVNIIQIAAGVSMAEGLREITPEHIEWVVNSSHISPRPEKKVSLYPQVGFVNGLAVYGPNMGTLIDIEVSTMPSTKGLGKINVTGIVEEEHMGDSQRSIRRKGMAKGSVENVLTILRKYLEVDPRNYDIHINFPGGVPIDGPSAGVSIATAIYSSIKNVPVDNLVAMTGEVSIRGLVKPVGGVSTKIQAAKLAGANKVIIPKDNWQNLYSNRDDIEIIPVENLEEVLLHALLEDKQEKMFKTVG
ncbi:ATP-dependent protease LonB [Candidatus Contubernalis alkaliaceticus]|uniref:ATP-dependent protease LonB n=1 Tax=Candidatus Contubernalis alkaliaceticus TaxID=338645 RepID=UPI001F4C4B48|nr:ATP-dependent protease LonB [Candidatus Contubernalis alkalaceticus]UNC90893.1 ATP-dependent protease LonB [Candidatus Contubernalis alkalaceticus]